ncbi:invasion associated locus B family protein [Celeribacter arenosi]|uniref:Invasion associated locus B family protein n=1 Tax=Celeribacter arenosi TaxID=792649 RepID=A0ABP7KI34_9RHOB
MLKKTFSVTAFALALSFGSTPLLAQDAEPEGAAEVEQPAVEPALSAGEPVETEIQAGQTYVLETEGDWEIRCIRTEGDVPEPCSIYQLLRDEQGTEVAEVTMFHLGQGEAEAAATFIAPLETLLTQQMTIFVDGANGRRYPFSFCTTVGCFVRAGLTGAEVDQFRRGVEGTVVIHPVAAPETAVRLPLSLKGFTAAYARVTELNKAARSAATQTE